MLKRLYAEHGKTINFLGVIMSTLNPKMEEKQRCVQIAGQIAVAIGAQGAVVAEEGYGNPDVDYTAMLVELERLGIKTIGLSDEATGRDGASQPLVSMNPATDASSPPETSRSSTRCRRWRSSESSKRSRATETPAAGKAASTPTAAA